MTHPDEDKRKKCPCDLHKGGDDLNHSLSECPHHTPTSTPKEEKCDTHSACFSRMEKEGGKSRCCYCVPHENCDFNAKSPDKEDLSESVDSKEVKKILPQDSMVESKDERWNERSTVAPQDTGQCIHAKEGIILCADKECKHCAPTHSKDWSAAIEKCFLTERLKDWPIPTVRVNPDTLKVVIASLLETEREKAVKDRVPMHLYNKHRDEMYEEGKAQGAEIGRTETLSKLKGLIEMQLLILGKRDDIGAQFLRKAFTDLLSKIEKEA